MRTSETGCATESSLGSSLAQDILMLTIFMGSKNSCANSAKKKCIQAKKQKDTLFATGHFLVYIADG